jgi:beta-phosphoglucomutase-like phosphatase (HAD superfamily)
VLDLPDRITALRFDLDGALTQTATVHAKACKQMSDEYRCCRVHAVVFEDARADVQAGRAGHFGWVVGVDGMGHANALREHGADVVIQDLAELLERDDT